MKSAMLMAYGSPDNHKIMGAPMPEPGPGQVRIKVAYAGLRFGDFYTLAGAFTVGAQPKPPFIPGQEISGVVEKLGEGVKNVKIGDRVASSTAQGAFAEYAVAPAAGLSFIPAKCDLGSYLVYYINLRVAYLAVNTFGQIKDGDKVLVHAPVGGVGQMIMEVLRKRLKNITIVAVTSTPEKMQMAKELGADFVINYKTSDYVKETIKYLGGRKIDVSLNGVGGSTMKVDAQTIRPLGRWVIYGFTAGFEHPVFSAYDSHTIIPFSILPVVAYWPQEFARTTAFLDEWVVKEKLMAPVIYPLEKIAEAEKALKNGTSTGKIVFKI